MPVLVRVGAAETGWLHPAFGRATAWIAVRVRRGSDPEPLYGLVASVLGENQIRRVPVLDGAELVGIISQADIARHLPEQQTGDVVQRISE